MKIRRGIVLVAGLGFGVSAARSLIIFIMAIPRPGNSLQLLLSLIGLLAAVWTWTLVDLVEKLTKPPANPD